MSLLLAIVAIAPIAQVPRTFALDPLGFTHASFQENSIGWEVNPGGLIPGWATYSQDASTVTMSVDSSTSANNYHRDSILYHQGRFTVGYRVWTSLDPAKINRLRFKMKSKTREYTEARLQATAATTQPLGTYWSRAHVDSPTLSADLRVNEAFRRGTGGLGATYGNGPSPGFKPLGSFLLPFDTHWTKSAGRWFTYMTYNVPWLYAKAEVHTGNSPTPTVMGMAQGTSSVVWEITAVAVDK
ncbi:hypothetical protein BH11ARM2_BH11ARM2_13900 [soil metagenome]